MGAEGKDPRQGSRAGVGTCHSLRRRPWCGEGGRESCQRSIWTPQPPCLFSSIQVQLGLAWAPLQPGQSGLDPEHAAEGAVWLSWAERWGGVTARAPQAGRGGTQLCVCWPPAGWEQPEPLAVTPGNGRQGQQLKGSSEGLPPHPNVQSQG